MKRAAWVLVVLLAPSLLAATPEPERVRLILSFSDEASIPDGIVVLHRYSSFPGVLVEAPLATLAQLPGIPGVLGVYEDEALETHLDLARPVLGLAGRDAPGGTGRGVGVAVIDSGIDPNHPAYRGRVETYALTGGAVAPTTTQQGTTGHGTEVLGVLMSDGAQSPGGRYRGLAPDARAVSIDLGAQFTMDAALRAFDWIHANHEAKGIRVVSNSWGRTGDVDGRFDPAAPLVRASDTLALEDGLVVVFSAGNRGKASSISPEALNPNVLTVGATDAGGNLGSFSSQGPGLDAAGAPLAWTKPDLVAIGDRVVTTRSLSGATTSVAGGRSLAPALYSEVSGTSYAAPMVAAAAAVLLEAEPALDREQVTRALTVTARDLGPAGLDALTGAGLLDIPLALDLATSGAVPAGTVRRAVEASFPAFEVVTAGGILARLGTSPGVDPGGEMVAYVPVVPGSPSLTVEATWTSAAPASFTARLVRPGGAAGPTLAGSGARLTATVASPEPGVWELRATPSGAVQQATLTLAGESIADRDVGGLALLEPIAPTQTATSSLSWGMIALGVAVAVLVAAGLAGAAIVAGRRIMRKP